MLRTEKLGCRKQKSIIGSIGKKYLSVENSEERKDKLEDKRFCDIKDVYGLVLRSTGQNIDEIYFNTTVELMRKKIGKSNQFTLTDEWMDLRSFLVLSGQLKNWYSIHTMDIADFIEQKFREKYTVTSADILGIISKAMEERPKEEESLEIQSHKIGRPRKNAVKPVNEKDMHKVVQNALKNGMTKTAIQKTYKLTQKELTEYEGYKYWSDSQKADHKAMLEYRRLHPDSSDKEAIEKGCGKDAVGYRFGLVPTKEQQEEYNQKVANQTVPKAVIKGTDVKSLILSDVEKEEQQELYDKIREIANARNVSPREVTTSFKARLTKDYGIVIDQIKKDLMTKFRVNRGEGKAPNALEAIVMSEYLPVAKSVLDSMLEESYTVK